MKTKTAMPETKQPNKMKLFFERPDVKNKFKELLKDKSNGFITSVLTMVNSSTQLKDCVIESVYVAALKAAVLDLPIAPELGFSYVLPFKNNKTGLTTCTFVIGYKGLLQLALRSQQIKTVSSAAVYEGQLKNHDPLKGTEFNWEAKTSDKIIGYAAYLKLSNGFEKTIFMTDNEISKHAERFSKTYKIKGSVWESDRNAMSQKTVLKKLISKYAPLSIDNLQQAVQEDDIFEGTDTEPIYDGIDITPKYEEGVDRPALGDDFISEEDLTLLFTMKRQSLTPTEISRAKNILDNKIQYSYQELATFLRGK